MDPLLDTEGGTDDGDAGLRSSLMISPDKRVSRFNSASSCCSDRTLAGAALVVSVASMVVGIVALSKEHTVSAGMGVGGMVWDGVASFNAFTVNWEAKNKAAWEAAVTDDIDMYVEGNSYSKNKGKDKVWNFRGFLPDAPDGNLLWTNMYDSWHFDPNDSNTLYARMTTYLRSECNPDKHPSHKGFCVGSHKAGSLYQLGRWTCKFDPKTGKVRYMHQKVEFALWLNSTNTTSFIN